MLRDTYLKLVALSHDEELSPELREAIRREIDGGFSATPEDFAQAEWASEEDRAAYMNQLLALGTAYSQMGSDGLLRFIDPNDFRTPGKPMDTAEWREMSESGED